MFLKFAKKSWFQKKIYQIKKIYTRNVYKQSISTMLIKCTVEITLVPPPRQIYLAENMKALNM